MAPIYERVQQVCDEEQSKRDLAAKDSSNSDSSASKQSNTATHACRSAVVRAALVTGTVAVVALALTTLCAGGFDRYVAPSSSNDGRRKLDLGERRRVKRAQVDAPTSSQPKYSSLTTTGEQGEPTTQSFVYTTRPIVNPGGYTIGTLTGYVQITATPTNNATSSSSSLLTEPTPTPTSTSTGTAAQEPTSTDYSRVPWVSRDHEGDEDASTTADPAAPTAPTRLAKRAQEEVIEDAESAPESSTVTEAPSPIATTPSATDGAEYSTSTDRAGSVYTLVKTTRPIVNPGGFTIGTLDGAWVDVAKQTQAANRKKRAASSPIAVPNPHDELRRRNVVDLAASA